MATQTNTNLSVLDFGRVAARDAGVGALEKLYTEWIALPQQTKNVRAIQWYENVAYLMGNHLTRFFFTNSGLQTFTFGISDSSTFDFAVAKSADNRLIRPVEYVAGMLCSPKPVPRVEPANPDDPDDEAAADIAQATVQYYFSDLDIAAIRQEAVQIASCFGTVAAEVEYGKLDTPRAVPEMRELTTENPFFDPEADEDAQANPREIVYDTEPTGRYRAEPRFGMTCRLWTPFHLTPDPTATTPEEMRWIARETFEDLDWVVAEYTGPKRQGFQFNNEEDMRQALGVDYDFGQHVLFWYNRFQEIVESPQTTSGGGFSAQNQRGPAGMHNQILLSVVDVAPSDEYPEGRTLIFGSGKLLYAGAARAYDVDAPKRWHPYVFFNWFKVTGRFWGVALLSELVPLQKRINQIDSIVAANRMYLGVGQWLIPEHTRMKPGSTSGLAGEEFTYRDVPGMRGPEKVRNVPLPGELLAERQLLIEAMMDIAGRGLLQENMSPSANRAGVIVDAMKREQLQSKTPMIQEFERFIEGIGKGILYEAQSKLRINDPELTAELNRVLQSQGKEAVATFTGASLREHNDVVIDIVNELIQSKEVKADNALRYLQSRQGMVEPHELETIYEMLGWSEVAKAQENVSVKRARRMIGAILKGNLDAAFEMRGIDRPKAMAPVFANLISGPRFQELPREQQAKLVEMFDTYSQRAAEEMQQQLQQQIAMAQAVKGGGGGV